MSPTTSHLAPAIADFILDDKRKGYDDELEQILTFLHDTWSKECESVNEKNQNSTKQLIIIKNPIIQDGSVGFHAAGLAVGGAININGC